MFYDVPALQKYKWFWRIEPGIDFTCSITYDPFTAMENNGKRYGYTVALWELGNTAPSLFRTVNEYKASKAIGSTNLWRAMVDSSWAPWPVRKLIMKYVPHRSKDGDAWSFCHFWSNFEIADLDFFRSKEYREFFDYLDRQQGFYHERVGFNTLNHKLCDHVRS
jgi:mannosyltransferase